MLATYLKLSPFPSLIGLGEHPAFVAISGADQARGFRG